MVYNIIKQAVINEPPVAQKDIKVEEILNRCVAATDNKVSL